MRIGIEMRQVTLESGGGISLLLKGLMETLFRQYPEHEYVVFSTMFSRGLLKRAPKGAEFRTLPIRGYFNQLDALAAERKLEVLFRSYPLEPSLAFPLRRQIFCVPDIQHEHLPEFFDSAVLRARRRAFTPALAGAGAIGTISEFARQTLLAQDCTQCRDIFLISPALQQEHRQASSADVTPEELALIPQHEFFLYPANLWPHKNHRRVLQAFAAFRKQTRRPMTFVCTGHPDGWPALQAEFPGLPVRHLGFVSAPLLRLLLQRARALAFFSLYEGFGMPLLEAFNAGAPVICSNTTSLPEVGGDAVLTCDPTDTGAIAALMARIVEDDSLRARLVARGKQRLPAYTWEQAAANLVAACDRVAADRPAMPARSASVAIDEWPLVSIVTPSFNQGRFLRRTIESVLRQTYPHIDYCVMDGGSTDESVDILKSYGDRFPWVSEADRGQTHAINKGLARGRGQVQAYLNSDDVLLPDAVEKAVAHFRRHPEDDLVYGRANYIDKNDDVTGAYNTDEYSFARLMQDCCICQPAAFWRTRIAKKVGPFDERLHYVMDYDYWLRIDRAGGRLKHIHDLLACSRLYPETKTLSGRYDIYQEIFRVCKEHGGQVDLNFCEGYWHHLCWERSRGLPHKLRRVPCFKRAMKYLHHTWLNRDRYTMRRILSGVKRRARRWLGRRLEPVGRLLSRIHGMPILLPPGITVSGVWHDNWLAPRCAVRLRPDAAGRLLHMAGTAPHDMTLTIRAKRRLIGRYQLRANRCVEISFRAPAELGSRLSLQFSNHVVDAARRRVSFLLQDTNLFVEADLA